MSSPLLSIRNVEKRFGATPVLEDVCLDIADGEFLTILGESGSGKTTLLRILAGFEQPSSGGVWMKGERLDTVPAAKRKVNTVFQQYALFPHLSVFENIAYGLRAQRVPAPEVSSRVEAALAQVKMPDFAARRPNQLSGGQQQRVALARALVNRPAMLLLDEPLSALDANLRVHMQGELKAIQRETGITFVFVTHDQEEAMALSDRIAVLRRGKLQQIDSPRELYRHPRTAYIATFIGKSNLLRLDDGLLYAVRPEHVEIVDADAVVPWGAIAIQGTVRGSVFAGSSELLEVTALNGPEPGATVLVRVAAESQQRDAIRLSIPRERLVQVNED